MTLLKQEVKIPEILPAETQFRVRQLTIDLPKPRVFMANLLPGGFDEYDHPTLALATAMLSGHPIVTHRGIFWTNMEIDGYSQGAFELTDPKTREKSLYAIRLGQRPDTQKILALWTLVRDGGVNYGYFNTKPVSPDSHHLVTLLPDTYFAHSRYNFGEEGQPGKFTLATNRLPISRKN